MSCWSWWIYKNNFFRWSEVKSTYTLLFSSFKFISEITLDIMIRWRMILIYDMSYWSWWIYRNNFFHGSIRSEVKSMYTLLSSSFIFHTWKITLNISILMILLNDSNLMKLTLYIVMIGFYVPPNHGAMPLLPP